MRPTPRTQPYRAGVPRTPGAVLEAMLAGRQPGQLNGADYNRQRMQMAAGPRPMAGINPPGGDLRNLIPQRRPGADSLRALAQAQLQMQSQQMHPQQAHPPVATADVRGRFGGAGQWSDPHIQRILAQLLGGSGPQRVL